MIRYGVALLGAVVLGSGLVACADGATAPLTELRADPPGAVVSVSDRALRGTVGDGVRRFRGIPYAAPPVGELRFAPPVPAASWPGERDATAPGPVCAQPGGGREDCLTLDVTAPTAPADEPRPVFVWLHGGGLSVGEGGEIDPSRMAQLGDVVVVTPEFRLGPLGFFGLPGLDGSGTFGLADQQAALRWVRDEIGAFGGDPDRVTLGGESGGAIGTCAQLTSPGARDLVDGAVLQSGECDASFPAGTIGPGVPAASFFTPRADMEAAGTAALARLGCTGPDAVECVRGLPVEALLAEGGNFAAAAYDTPLLPVRPADALRAGDAAPVPVLSGANRDEGTLLAQTYEIVGAPITDADLPARLAEVAGDRIAEVRSAYPREAYSSAVLTWAAVASDQTVCAQLATNAALGATGPVFAYEFADRTSPGYAPLLPAYREAGATHAAELPYLFDIRDKPIGFDGAHVPLTAQQRALGDTMIRHWTAFVRDGDPGPGWTASPDGRDAVRFAPDGPAPLDAWAEHRCDLWTGPA